MLDGSLMYAARRELQDAADSAALAGAMQVDLAWFDRYGRWRIAEAAAVPGTRSADEAVQEVCDAYGVTCTSSVPTGFHGRLLQVHAEADFTTVFIHLLLGRSQFRLQADAAAIMVPGY
jgi:hypothetical protein